MTSTLEFSLEVVPGSGTASALAEWQRELGAYRLDMLPALADRGPISAEAFITLAAGVGLFGDEPAMREPKNATRRRFSLDKLSRRDYVVRHAVQSDLSRLCQLEKLCWQHTRSSRKQILARLTTYPQGQFVLEKAGQVQGVIYSQRIADVDALDSQTAASVSGLHQPSGSIIQLLAVNIDPAQQSFGYGDQLLEFMLQRSALVAGIDRVVGVTLCRNFAGSGAPSLEQYIRRDDDTQDPILAFHAAHGASIVKLLPGYRPADRANLGHGVLVSYDILQRAPRRRAASASKTLDPVEARRFVQEKVTQLLGADAAGFHMDRPLMEMGLDSADLLKLQQQFEETLGQKLAAGFFFEFNSARKVVGYFTDAQASVAPARPQAHAAADIAIVGLSCKLPGGIETPEELWQALSSGSSLIGRYPEGRGPWPSATDMPGIDQGGFVRDADAFDAGFFRMSRAEALVTDPQQRLLLQLGWACLEDAGTLPSSLRGTNTGVFIGASNCDYSRLVQEAGFEVQAHHGVGSSLAILANRLSYFFDFSGPSLVIDTACSSSLVALHTAMQSLRAGECATALVGGVNLICHPDLSIAYHKAGMLAPDGRCKPFDASANGYVRSEGAVMLLLKPLESALANGDRIHAVIKGSAINHGGLAGGLTVPNPQKQSELLRAAWKNAGITASDLSYIEAHGTGTSLGDPIELQGIQVAFGPTPSGAGKSCAIGSVKSNLGHLESAAGLAGLLKVVVCMKHRQLPPSIGFSQLNPKIRLDGTPLYIQQPSTWSSASPLLAAVSSFGSGGANAHAVIAEFPRALPCAPGNDDQLFVLSAMSAERLRAYASQVNEWLTGSNDIDFTDAIHTWQAGRTAMPHRLAIKTSGFADLRDKLNRWLAGMPAAAHCWSGEGRSGEGWNGEASADNADAGNDDAGSARIGQALRENDLELLGALWTSGVEFEWSSREARHICSVPTYPFARERFWVDMPVASPAGASVLHPLLHANVSDLERQVYQSTFDGSEFFLADHRVNLDDGAKPVLPAVAYLEMARAAIEKALPRASESTVLELRDTLWTQPLMVSGQKQVRIELAADDADEIEYEIQGENGDVVHCEGRAAFIAVPTPARLDLEKIRATLRGAGRDTAEVYESLARMGLVYGPAHRALTALFQTTGQALAHLSLADSLRPTSGDYLLHPSLMDGALQAAVALVTDANASKPSLPFALDSLRIFAAPGAAAFAWVRDVGQSHDAVRKMDIDLCDEHGAVCVQMRGFSVREAKGERSLPARQSGLPCIVPHWNPYREARDARATLEAARILLVASDVDVLTWMKRTHANSELLHLPACATLDEVRESLRQRSFDRLVWVAPDVTRDGQSIIEAQESGVLTVFRIAKALLDLGYADHELAWTLITRRTQKVRKGDVVQPAHAGVFGLIGSLAKEYPQWNLSLADVDSLEFVTAAECLSLPADKRGNGVACRQGEWLRQEFAAVPALPADRPVYYRQNGVYVVIGGAGGLGEVWSRFMIEHFQARMVWIGREEINDTIRAKIDTLGRLGSAPLYVRADATDFEALQRASATILRAYPAIHGVVHSAIILQDKSVQHMDESRFRAGLSAKVDISVNLDLVFGTQPLDFMLFFSSVLSFIRSPGQSNYAAGCTFKDSFAASLRSRRAYPVKTVNWGYWGKVGVVANDAHGKSMGRLGFGSIEPEEGMSALQALIGSELGQAVLVKTADGRSIEDLETTERLVRYSAVAAGTPGFVAPVSQRRPTAPEGGLETPVMDELLAELLAATLAATAHSTPAHQRWIDSSQRFLQQRGLTGAVRSLPALWTDWQSKKVAWEANPNLRAQVRLVEACLKALSDVLAGNARATDIMFPGSSMQLVEGIYRDNALADHFNEVLGDTLLACAQQRSKAGPIRILEIGAGTGGTTAVVLPALEDLAVAEYCYTDVSRAFLMHGEEHYQPQFPALTTALFDVSKPVASQSVDAGGFDFVIATNVLHATPNIRETLRNAKALLKNEGVLLLNEISTWSLFSHLTFGLLEGWWLHEDAGTRLTGSPGLSPDQWREVLAEEGFDSIGFPAERSHRFGQQVIAARSDGWVRQKAAGITAVPANAPAAANMPAQLPASTPPVGADAESTLRPASIAYFQTLVAATLRMKPDEIEPQRRLGEYGLDSILIGQLNYQLRKIFPGISSTLFFEVQTVAALADYFLAHRKSQLQAVLPATTAAAEPVVATPPRATRSTGRGRSSPKPEAKSIVDVAIVGLSGRYPRARNLGEFWNHLANGVNCITQIPADRWRWEDHTYSQWGGFLDGIDEFDPLFFKIAPKEAKRMDPQERLFLQSCYHAIEDAGYTPEGLGAVDKIGVFVGVMNSRYTPQPAHYSIANRVSYFFNFQGPSMAVDTACSSSLTAIHLALESLYSGMSECAIAGGVNLIIDAVHYQELSELTMLSSGKECRAFGERADGFVDAEGVGAVILKRLDHAERDGDHIYGVIKGSAINAGGKTNGYTVPNPLAQAALVSLALERARIPADHVSYVEAHGTGTALGDPIEIAGLTRAFSSASVSAGDATQYCAIGSLKSNIGHCESAAGIAGLTKVLLQLKHGQLVPSLHSAVPNPGIDFTQTPFRVQQTLASWTRPLRTVNGTTQALPRIAGVSSFGAGGSNAHLIVEEYQLAQAEPRVSKPVIIPLSARTPEQLRQKARDLLEHVRAESLDLAAVAFTLQAGREALEERFGMLVSSVEELTAKLEAFIAGSKDIADTVQGRAKRNAESQAAVPAPGTPLAALLKLWAQGAQIDWQVALDGTRPRRVSLPPYPFAKERYWVDRTPAVQSAAIHPLLHVNTSDLGLQRYSSTFTGRESFLVERKLPAMAHLEMARVAVERASLAASSAAAGSAVLELRDVAWARPVALREAGTVHVALRERGDIDFEIYSQEGESETVHCQGRAAFSAQPAPAVIDIGELGARMTQGRLDAHRSISAVQMGDRQLLAQLRLPEPKDTSLADYVLHPSLMEGAMQAAAGLIEGWKTPGNTLRSPISLESLRVFWPCASEMLAWVRVVPANSSDDTYIRVDLDLCDAQGRVCVQMRGLRYAAVVVAGATVASDAKPAVPAERPKVSAVSLAAPAAAPPAIALAPTPSSTRRPAVTLLNPLEAAVSTDASTALRDLGGGIFELRADAAIESLLLALAEASNADVKVLIVSGAAAHASQEFHEEIAAFPVPTIAVLAGDASGTAFLASALCDFMALSESANYSFAQGKAARQPSAAQEALLAERLGVARSYDFLHVSATSTGAELREKGWTCLIAPRAEVEFRARELATVLAAKSRKALRLLKQHLSRPFHELVRNLASPDAPAHEPAPRAEGASGNQAESTRCFSLSTPIDAADVLVVTLGDDDVWPRDLAHGLARTIARANASSNYKAIVFSCECRDFLAHAPEGVYEEFRNLLLESRIPVIGALTANARGLGWLASQFFDACIYCTESVYSFDDTVAGLPVEREAAVMFPLRFGDCLGREIVLTGADYSGADLKRRAGAVALAARAAVLPEALKVARDWIRRPREEVVAWKGRMASLIRARIEAAPHWPAPGARDEADAPALSAPTPVRLESTVVSATAHPDGILVVRMEDRQAKNLFSDAFVAGVREVFAHIEQTPSYKAVILTGYDSYFASGGTQETLLAIQEGRAKFTDFKIFQLPMECRVPVIAAMQGHGIGGGWSLGMFADLVLMSEESRFVSPYMDYGFTPGAGSTLIFPRQIGHDLARESLLTAHSYSGAELRSRGISVPVLARDEVLPAALGLARKIARAARRHLVGLKWQLTHSARAALSDIYERELAMHEQTFVGQSAVVEQIQGNFLQAPAHEAVAAAPAVEPPRDSDNGDALTEVKREVRKLLAAELQMQESDVDEDVQFIDLGMDSIAAVTWVRRINDRYKLSMLATKVYSYPTLKQLSRFITDEAQQRGTLPQKKPAAIPAMAPLAPVASVASVAPAPAPKSQPAAHRVLVSWRHGSTSRAEARPTAIAVIGIAGQFPQARNVEEFWSNIASGRSGVTEIPAQRWDIESYYRAGAAVPGKTNSRWMGALEHYDRFDPLFFNISPTEAENMDPQQRLFLEACWHAIENAGYDADALSGSKCGVFAGCANGDYQAISPDQRLSAQGFTGGANSILAARIAYFLNLQGPCLSIDTACSSSLAALAAACDSLVSGASDVALAGGVAVMATPEMHIKTSQAGMLSPDGRCFTFDQRANGFVPGEAVGVVMLKRLADAERDGDLIGGVIEGWGVNQDGKTNGITAPNPESQSRLQRETYDRFRIDPSNIQLIEAHGTGTKLGDPIEIEGLKGSFAKYTQKKRYCALGSVKSDIGHCLAAAGIAGFIKLVLALRERQLPPTINFEKLNEHIELDDSPFFVNDRLQEWRLDGADRRRAAISAFGFSGTNVHVVLAEHASNDTARTVVTPSASLIPLSARNATQLRQKAQDLLDFVRDASRPKQAPIELARLAYTLQVGRTAMEERVGFVASSLDELTAKLQEYLQSAAASDTGTARRDREISRLLGEDADLKDIIVERWIAQRKLPKLLDLWTRGVALDWNKLHGEVKPSRMRLPLYPFARERYWIDAAESAPAVAPARLHPLLHTNTSDFRQQRYQSEFNGAEFFLNDHRVRLADIQKVLPGVAYLEMARAAMTHASRETPESAVLELRNTVWLKPLVVAEPALVSITLAAGEDDEAGDQVAFEISTGDEATGTVHCQGVATFVDRAAPARLDLARLEAQMTHGRVEPATLYAAFEQMGLHYGPAHRAVAAIEVGEGQLLASLRLPGFLAAGRKAYLLHPAIMDSALQASVSLITRLDGAPAEPIVPFAMDSLRICSPDTLNAEGEMFAWIRYTQGSRAGDEIVRLDIDVCDSRGNVGVAMRGFAVRVLGATAAGFDEAFYQRMIEKILNEEMSAADAAQMG